jgi:hypothetical protein
MVTFGVALSDTTVGICYSPLRGFIFTPENGWKGYCHNRLDKVLRDL